MVNKIERAELKKFVDEMLDNRIEQFYRDVPYARHFMGEAALDMAYYRRHTIETILRIRRKRTIDAFTIRYFTHTDPVAAKEWAEYTDDEMLHDRLFLADLEKVGMQRDEVYATEPFLSTKLLNGYFLYCLEYEGTPLAAIASSYFLEYTTRKTQPDWLDGLDTKLGREKVKGARAHVNYDIAEDHTGDVWNVLMRLVKDEADEKRLLGHFDALYKLFTWYFEEVYQATREPVEV